MSGKVSTLRLRQMFTRRCVACGVAVDHPSDDCVHCGCNFAQRPPRSYAEMEGLVGQPLDEREPEAASASQESRPSRLVERWLLFIFLSLMMIVGIAMLASAAMGPVR